MKKRSSFTLLELMIGIVILALSAGVIGWKIDGLIQRQQFETDAGKLKNLFHHARMLALNTRADWILNLKQGTKGWSAHLICREDPERTSSFAPSSKFGPFKLFIDEKAVDQFSAVFYSGGKVEPEGTLKIKGKEKREIQWTLSELFFQDRSIEPAHPRELASTEILRQNSSR